MDALFLLRLYMTSLNNHQRNEREVSIDFTDIAQTLICDSARADITSSASFISFCFDFDLSFVLLVAE